MRSLSALFLFCSLGHAEVVYPGFSLIAHIVDGGGIQTELTLTNLDDTPSTYTVWFWDDNGNRLSIATSPANSDYFVTLAPRASRRIRTAGTASTQTVGWASITTTGNVGASAILRVSAGPWTGSDVVIPADPARNNRFSLAFDQADSSVIGLAIVNPLNGPIAVTMTFRGEDGGVIVSDTFNMGSRAHRTIVTTSSYPAAAGRRGTIEISTSSSYLSVLALRFGPSAISSVVPLVSHTWSNIDNPCWSCWDY
jgi:hypothetical protein